MFAMIGMTTNEFRIKLEDNVNGN